MKKLLPSFAALMLACSAGAATAADLPSKKGPVYLPPPPPLLTWSGFYIGLNAGYTWGNGNTTTIGAFPVIAGAAPSALALAATSVTPNNSADGFIGGGQVGYNWQMNNFVLGAEADIQGVAGSSRASQTLTATTAAGATFLSQNSAVKSIDYFGTVRGRVGYLFTPNLLLYGTAGLAYGGAKSNVAVTQFGNNGFIGFGGAASNSTRVGWTAGGGVEWMFLPNWSAKAEYLYYDLGTVQQTGALVGANVAPTGLYAATQSSTRFDGHVVRAGVNYHFNFGAPSVVAKF